MNGCDRPLRGRNQAAGRGPRMEGKQLGSATLRSRPADADLAYPKRQVLWDDARLFHRAWQLINFSSLGEILKAGQATARQTRLPSYMTRTAHSRCYPD